MPQFVLTRRAENDLSDITVYTLQVWGRKQTAKYMRQIRECAQLLCERPALGKQSPIDDGLRQFPVGRHAIFY